jgi:hypothetical protein
MDYATGILKHLPQFGGASMAQDGSLAARKDRGLELTPPSQTAMPDGVNTAMHPMKPAGRDAPCDRALVEAGRAQLRGRDDAVLPRRDPRDRQIPIDELFSHIENKSPAPDRAPLGN